MSSSSFSGLKHPLQDVVSLPISTLLFQSPLFTHKQICNIEWGRMLNGFAYQIRVKERTTLG